jgi:hypothetical protein
LSFIVQLHSLKTKVLFCQSLGAWIKTIAITGGIATHPPTPNCWKWCCYILMDFPTAASQNGFCITQQTCQIMILFHDCSWKKIFCFLPFSE